MARLPAVGGDLDQWGTLLNAYLEVQHNLDGTHPASSVAGLAVPIAGTTDIGIQQQTFYVSNGSRASDSNSGTDISSPFRTLAQAFTAAAGNPFNLQIGYGNFPATGATMTVPNRTRISGLGPFLTTITSSSGDVFVDGANGFADCTFENFGFSTSAGAGHLFNSSNIFNRGVWRRLQMSNGAGNKSCFTSTVGMNECTFEKIWMYGVNQSVPHFNLAASTNNGNGNHFRSIVIQDAHTPTSPLFVYTGTGSRHLVNNTFADITFENPIAGAMVIKGTLNTRIDGVGIYDLSATTTANMIEIDVSSGGLNNQNCQINRYYTDTSAALGAGLYDINLGDANQDVHVKGVTYALTGSAKINLNGSLTASVENLQTNVTVTGGPWQPVSTFATGWSNYTGVANLAALQYKFSADGKTVYIVGTVTTTGGGSGQIATLPASIRPVTTKRWEILRRDVIGATFVEVSYTGILTSGQNSAGLILDLGCLTVPLDV